MSFQLPHSGSLSATGVLVIQPSLALLHLMDTSPCTLSLEGVEQLPLNQLNRYEYIFVDTHIHIITCANEHTYTRT